MASLANQTISSTYDGLIKTSTDQPVPISGVQLLEDGVGNSLALSVGRANQGVTVTGTLTATSISGVLADGVTATTQTLGDNSTKVATTAYVDAQVTASDLDFAGDSGTGAVDLDSQTFTIAGTANEIETSASGQTVTIGLPSSVTVGTLSATTLGGTLSTAAQPNITSVGTLSSLTVSGNVNIDSNTLFVDSSANQVGINTNTPSREFEVTGAGNVYLKVSAQTDNDAAALELANTQETWTIINQDLNDDALEFSGSTNGTALTIKKDGNVGIGTASPSAFSNYSTLSINGTNGGILNLKVSETETARLQAFSGAFNIAAKGASTELTFETNGSERMRIDSSGNVGIGATNPSDKLVVIGDVASTGSLKITGNSSTPSAGAFVHRPASNTLALGTASTERMRIDSIGRISVGFSSWSSFGVVNLGVGQEDEGRVTIARGSNGQVARFYNSTGFAGDITLTGASTAYNTSSDYRLKENVVEMTGALDRVGALKPSRFNFIADPETTVDGFLAHEVAEVVPEAISGEKDAVDEEGNPVYQGIDQSKLVPLLVGAIKELRAEIETLKSQINA